MGARGRKSTAELTALRPEVTRPRPPACLTKEQAQEWRAVVNRMPEDWFPRETHQLLVQYCRHATASKRIAELIADMEAGNLDVNEYDRLLKMQEREGRALSSLATRMRISQQSSYDKQKSKDSSPVKKPWEA